MTVEIKTGENTKTKVSATCGTCKGSTKHEILAYASRKFAESNDYDNYQSFTEYQVVQCLGCELISFRRTYTDSETIEQTGPDEYEYPIQIDQYPNPESGRASIEDDHLLPNNLQRIYEETLKSLNGGLSVLAGIGVRAIVETVCKEKNSSGKDLYSKINDLVTQGVMTKEGAQILHKLRTLGNDAAHEVKPHSNVQLGLAMDVIDHLLKGVYILPHHAAKTFK